MFLREMFFVIFFSEKERFFHEAFSVPSFFLCARTTSFKICRKTQIANAQMHKRCQRGLARRKVLFLVPQFPTTQRNLTCLCSSSCLVGKPNIKKKSLKNYCFENENLHFSMGSRVLDIVWHIPPDRPARCQR